MISCSFNSTCLRGLCTVDIIKLAFHSEKPCLHKRHTILCEQITSVCLHCIHPSNPVRWSPYALSSGRVPDVQTNMDSQRSMDRIWLVWLLWPREGNLCFFLTCFSRLFGNHNDHKSWLLMEVFGRLTKESIGLYIPENKYSPTFYMNSDLADGLHLQAPIEVQNSHGNESRLHL